LGRTGHEWRDLFIDGTANIDSLVADTADINAGTIDNTTIGTTTAAAAKVTTLDVTSTLALNGDTGVSGYVLTSNGASAPTWQANANGLTIVDDTTTNSSFYLTFTSASTGNITTANVSSTKLQFNPSTGALTATTLTPTNALGAAYGGTGLTSLGSGVATWLGTPSSANLAAAVTDETGSGSLVFATSPTFVTPVLGTPTSGNLSNCTVDGTNAVGYRNLPAVGTKTTSYTLQTADVGKYVQVGSSGSITIPDATFAEGDAVSIFNNTTGNITITCTITTAYIAGTDSDKASVTLSTRGVATILFISGTICVITGNVT
jgi:hypothetical protein